MINGSDLVLNTEKEEQIDRLLSLIEDKLAPKYYLSLGYKIDSKGVIPKKNGLDYPEGNRLKQWGQGKHQAPDGTWFIESLSNDSELIVIMPVIKMIDLGLATNSMHPFLYDVDLTFYAGMGFKELVFPESWKI